MTADPSAFARACCTGFIAAVAPLIGVEPTAKEPELGPESALPEGDLAVLPLALTREGSQAAAITLHTPLAAIGGIARRMLGDSDPEKERELTPADLDGVGKLFGLFGGALDAAARAHLDAGARCTAQRWWRTQSPGDNAFATGPHVVASCKLALPSGVEIPLALRLPDTLLASLGAAEARARNALLLGFEDAARDALTQLLTAARIEARAAAVPGAGESADLASVDIVLLAADAQGALDACRALRLANASWRMPAVACTSEPTRDSVLAALASGASHVLRLPADEATLLRVLRDARR